MINGENKEIQDYIMNVAYLSDFNTYVGDSEYGYQNAYIYMMIHIDKKTHLIDKVKIKAKNNRYSPANIIDVNLKNNYGGEPLVLPVVIIKDH